MTPGQTLVCAYGIGCAAALWFAAHSYPRDRRGASQCVGILTLAWGVYGISYLGDNKAIWPALDLVACLAIAVNHRADRRPYKLWIIGFYCCQMFCHVRYWQFVAIGADSRDLRYVYRSALNALFIAQLLAGSSSGLRRAWNDLQVHLRSPGGYVRGSLRGHAYYRAMRFAYSLPF